ncbi:hypothetical protein [Streptomyces sp. LN704]|uniref:SCO4402 family protein n=1 Tax=Streptomyces sp. LN704 TaxID=3112982 RepID=UPI0037227B7D
MEDMEFPELSGVTLPAMRRDVLLAVRALADKGHQRRVWIEKKYPQEGYYDDFGMNLDTLYDDTLVLEEPSAALGTVLRDGEEVSAMESLRSALNELLSVEGGGRTDSEYLASPLWETVVVAAIEACVILCRGSSGDEVV